MQRRTFLTALTAALIAAPVSATVAAETLTVYTSRNEQLIQPVFDAFTKATGITVRFTTDKDGALIERNAGCGIVDVMSSSTFYRNVTVCSNYPSGVLLSGF
ncbi:MAG TPA: hypothetical protein PKI22_07395, partial [Hydrogenophilus thermoluteolus]|nr:hypothetical protein [Hydrogenophilus thermoluteolus]